MGINEQSGVNETELDLQPIIEEKEEHKKLRTELADKENKRQIEVQAHNREREHKLLERNIRRKIKNKYKLKKMETNDKHKEAKDFMRSHHRRLRLYNFFTKWFYIGLILILVSVCLHMMDRWIKMDSLAIDLIYIFASLLSTIGIALVVSAVFDFSKNSEVFISFISKLLTEIIVSKTFLSSLSAKDKRDALKLIIQPTNKQIEQYSNINEYFKKKIEDSMQMFDTNFKTNVVLNVEAKIKDGIVICETILTYTIYKVKDDFEPISARFEKDKSFSEYLQIICEDGPIDNEKDFITTNYKTIGGRNYILETYIVPERYKKYDHLTVRRKAIEPGSANWINYSWKSMTPYEDIKCYVRCFDGLKIKDAKIFDNDEFYHMEQTTDGSSLSITSSKWLEAHTGFQVLIGNDTISTMSTINLNEDKMDGSSKKDLLIHQ